MQLEEFFDQQAAENPDMARRFAQADAELHIALETARRRKARGITQRELAARMGVPQSVVGRFEMAGRSPSFGTLCSLADALGVRFVIEPSYLVSVQPYPVRTGSHLESHSTIPAAQSLIADSSAGTSDAKTSALKSTGGAGALTALPQRTYAEVA
jgi:transcriptional regulator with XRE-family HTH domain